MQINWNVSCNIFCYISFRSELPDFPEKSRRGKKTNSKAITKRYALQANARSFRFATIRKDVYFYLVKFTSLSKLSSFCFIINNNNIRSKLSALLSLYIFQCKFPYVYAYINIYKIQKRARTGFILSSAFINILFLTHRRSLNR